MVAAHIRFRMEVPNHNGFVQSRARRHCEFFHFDEDELDTSELQVRLIDHDIAQRLLYGQDSHRRHQSPPTSLVVGDNDIGNESDDAERLFSSLRRIAPSVAKGFVTKPSNQSSLRFKLIHDFNDLPGQVSSYIAISYPWKKANWQTPQKIISPVGDLPFGWVRTVEQFPLPTSKGLFMGVLNEREKGEGLWFDQICIAQENETEKSVAIGAMDSIYRNARLVVVALDDVAATWDEYVFLQRYVQQYDVLADHAPSQQLWQPQRELQTLFSDRNFLLRSFMEKVLDSTWFSSAWCYHEMSMGRGHVFLVSCPAGATYKGERGGFCTVLRFTRHFMVHMLLLLAGEFTTLAPSRQVQIQSLLRIFGTPGLPHHNHSDPSRDHISTNTKKALLVSETVTLVPTITEVFHLKAGGNPRLPEHLRRLDANRDKISITLNISNIPLALKPAMSFQRPSHEDEAFRLLLLVGLASRDPLALCTTGPPLKLHDGSVSWLSRPCPPDLRFSSYRPSESSPVLPKLPEHDVQNMRQGSDGQAEYIQLEFVFLERPPRLNADFSFHSQRARNVIIWCAAHRVESHNALWSIIVPRDEHTLNLHQYQDARIPALHNAFIQALACAFECGLEWLLDNAASISPQTPNLTHHVRRTLESLFTPSVSFTDYVTHAERSRLGPSLTILLGVLGDMIASGIPWASGATEASHGPLVVTLPPPTTSNPPPPCITNSAPPTSTYTLPEPIPSQPWTPFHLIIPPHSSPRPHTVLSTIPYNPQTIPPSQSTPPSTTTTNKAVIFAPYASSKVALFAIPKALSSPEYKTLPRVWILTPKPKFTSAYSVVSPPLDHAFSSGFGTGMPSSSSSSSLGFTTDASSRGFGVGVGSTAGEMGVVRWVLSGKSVLFGAKGADGEVGRLGRDDGGGGVGSEVGRRRHWVFGPGSMEGG